MNEELSWFEHPPGGRFDSFGRLNQVPVVMEAAERDGGAARGSTRGRSLL